MDRDSCLGKCCVMSGDGAWVEMTWKPYYWPIPRWKESALAKSLDLSAWIQHTDKPVGVLMLVGPSGVGKTETALVLGSSYGRARCDHHLNMSEFQEPHTVSTLEGPPPAAGLAMARAVRSPRRCGGDPTGGPARRGGEGPPGCTGAPLPGVLYRVSWTMARGVEIRLSATPSSFSPPKRGNRDA